MQQEAGQHGARHALRPPLRSADSEETEQAAPLDESGVGCLVDDAQQRRSSPGVVESEGVAVQGVDVLRAGEDQSRGGDPARGDRRGRCRRRGEQRRDGLDRRVLRRREDGGPGPHAVPGDGEAFRLHADPAGAQPDTGADVEGCDEIGGESEM
ncbi:hypothetical protein GS469_22460 [Rhodococcus hoagii]|nr:hypothetical protein [Prescottella equi]MBM4591812.1 hypothetical protein [Prescottella equi]